MDKIRMLAEAPEMIKKLTEEINRKQIKQLPALKKQKATLESELGRVKSQADALISKWLALDPTKQSGIIKDKLTELDKRKAELDNALACLSIEMTNMQDIRVDSAKLLEALRHITEVIGTLPPYKQKQLVQAVFKSITLTGASIDMQIYAGATTGAGGTEANGNLAVYSCSERYEEYFTKRGTKMLRVAVG